MNLIQRLFANHRQAKILKYQQQRINELEHRIDELESYVENAFEEFQEEIDRLKKPDCPE